MKITQELSLKVQEYIDTLNKNLEYPEEEYTVHFFDDKGSIPELEHPWISIDFGHNPVKADIIVELKNRFPDVVIYVSASDSDVDVTMQEETFEQMDREQMEYNRKQEARQTA